MLFHPHQPATRALFFLYTIGYSVFRSLLGSVCGAEGWCFHDPFVLIYGHYDRSEQTQKRFFSFSKLSFPGKFSHKNSQNGPICTENEGKSRIFLRMMFKNIICTHVSVSKSQSCRRSRFSWLFRCILAQNCFFQLKHSILTRVGGIKNRHVLASTT